MVPSYWWGKDQGPSSDTPESSNYNYTGVRISITTIGISRTVRATKSVKLNIGVQLSGEFSDAFVFPNKSIGD